MIVKKYSNIIFYLGGDNLKLTLLKIPLGAYQTNCYIIGNTDNKKIFLIDPGAQGKELLAELNHRQLEPQAILLTHGHSDHIGAVQELVDTYNIPIYMHPKEVPFLTDSELNLSAFQGLDIQVHGTIHEVIEGDTISYEQVPIKVIETPGHTPGGISFYMDGILFAGDTLFRDSVGRTDFPYGSFDDLIVSIQTKLMNLPDDTIVYPGHGLETTIGYEKKSNPFIG